LTKQKRKKQRSSRSGGGSRSSRQPDSELLRAFRQIEKLLDDHRASEAITLLEPLLSRYPRVAELHYYHGFACLQVGNPWAALDGYERAVQWSRESAFWLPLAWLYLKLEMNVHALQAFRQALRRGMDASEVDDVRAVVAELDDQIQQTGSELRLQVPQVERGLRSLEVGFRALQGQDYAASVAANRQAVKALGIWPPANNNLALALFFDGRPQEAITISRRVLSHDPANLHALANAIRFLAWTDQEEEARALWPRLQAVEPQDADDRFKMAEAAAILNQDTLVWELLRPLDKADATLPAKPPAVQRVQFFLAIAEANLGKTAARRRLEALQPTLPWAKTLLAALQAGKPGPGWASRFPYFSISDLIAWPRMQELVDLMERQERMPGKRFREQMARLLERFPQLVLVAEKMLWEEEQAEPGIALLEAMATPGAYAALRRFGLSQAGSDDVRMMPCLPWPRPARSGSTKGCVCGTAGSGRRSSCASTMSLRIGSGTMLPRCSI
jgi:tetratricopeptide (TPR) repeat protein